MNKVKFAKDNFGQFKLVRSFVRESQECHDFSIRQLCQYTSTKRTRKTQTQY